VRVAEVEVVAGTVDVDSAGTDVHPATGTMVVVVVLVGAVVVPVVVMSVVVMSVVVVMVTMVMMVRTRHAGTECHSDCSHCRKDQTLHVFLLSV